MRMLMAARPRPRVRGAAPSRPVRSRAAASNGRQGQHVAEVQRARLLGGAVRAVDELGYARVTVSEITARARVSRRTFYELFEDREECMLALLNHTVERVRGLIAAAELDGLSWCERVRGGLLTILGFLDGEPALARVCVARFAQGTPRVLERREQIMLELAGVIDEGRGEGVRAGDCVPLTAEGLAGAAVSIVSARLSREDSAPLSELTGELMGMIVLPYQGPAAARRELARPVPKIARPPKTSPAAARGDDEAQAGNDLLEGISMRLTYRTVRVLETVAGHPGVSNRIVGEQAGIPDQGQASKLLARLERNGLLQNTGNGHSKGEANAWRLTAAGVSVTQAIGITPGKATG
jgi:AcrR family transcriptional regulator